MVMLGWMELWRRGLLLRKAALEERWSRGVDEGCETGLDKKRGLGDWEIGELDVLGMLNRVSRNWMA